MPQKSMELIGAATCQLQQFVLGGGYDEENIHADISHRSLVECSLSK